MTEIVEALKVKIAAQEELDAAQTAREQAMTREEQARQALTAAEADLFDAIERLAISLGGRAQRKAQ
jgi:hypothetical protein